ncbi:hypothetical protein F5I97DRAFT_1419171 [Phlebopus sp. FC_14]|nr:hypothetical protein F5I97DRAFT_1419171 [Phlebopus sp. FC_14]
MSETKASKIIKLLHDNDFGPSIFLAISNNDEHAFQSALVNARLAAGDLTLSQDEYDNLVKGVKPSGELNLLTWEGYYVVTSSPQNDPLALLILANTGKVYWGAQSQVLAHPIRHIVDYKITSDNKLHFSTQADGFVSISLTREYDKDKAIATVKFSLSGLCQYHSEVFWSFRSVGNLSYKPRSASGLCSDLELMEKASELIRLTLFSFLSTSVISTLWAASESEHILSVLDFVRL